jgi:hypothetical protein
MNFANAQYHTSDHVDVGRSLRQARTGIVANPQVQTVHGFLTSPRPTFTSPAEFNPGHLLPPQDITGAPQPMTAAGRTAVWSTFKANVAGWYRGFNARANMDRPPTAGTGALPGPGYF